MIKCVTKIKNKTNKNNKQNGKRKMKTKISFESSIFVGIKRSNRRKNKVERKRFVRYSD